MVARSASREAIWDWRVEILVVRVRDAGLSVVGGGWGWSASPAGESGCMLSVRIGGDGGGAIPLAAAAAASSREEVVGVELFIFVECESAIVLIAVSGSEESFRARLRFVFRPPLLGFDVGMVVRLVLEMKASVGEVAR